MQLVKDHINILLPLTVVSAICRVIPGMGFLYYLTPILLVMFIVAGYDKIFQNKSLKFFLKLLIAFGFWAMITALWSEYPLVSLSRGAYFLLIAVGGTLGATLWRDTKAFKKNPFGFLLPANILIVVSNLISLIIGFPEESWTGGNGMGFMGFFAHQNTLGMALLFTFPAPFYLLLCKMNKLELCHPDEDRDLKSNLSLRAKRGNLKRTTFIFYIFLLLSNVSLLLLSYSRASLLALAVGITLTFFLSFNKKTKNLFYWLSYFNISNYSLYPFSLKQNREIFF